MNIHTPDWVKHAVFYQIFPDRFARSRRTQHPRGITFKPWGTSPDEQGFQGGDLRGIVDKLDYLQELGITALYLNPVFASAANHRYHTYDYYQVDPILGGNDALRELLDEAHARDMRVVLDGVFNHASRGFWPFHHILETGKNSPYLDWFIVHDWPLRPYNPDPRFPANYEAWAGLPALPKFNTDNPGVRDYIFDVAQHWLEFGIDGWRLDVPMEIDDDDFWREFRTVIKDANPEAYVVGEVWEEAQRWLQGDMFDAVMNYIFMWAAISYCGAQTLRPDYDRKHLRLEPLPAEALRKTIDHMHGLYDWAVNHAQLNLLDSHDTGRALWIMGEDTSALKLAALFQMTMPGAPCIYYGDEVGLSAGDDPHCRGAFPWHAEETWDTDLLDHYRRATALRHRYPVLRTGSFEAVHAEEWVYAFRRRLDEQEAVVVFNAGTEASAVTVEVPAVQADGLSQAWPDDEEMSFTVRAGQVDVRVPARGAVVLVS